MRQSWRVTSLFTSLLLALTGAVVAFGPTGAAQAAVDFTVRPSVNQLMVLGATPGTQLELVPAGGGAVSSGTVDDRGSLMWRDIEAGVYTVRVASDPAQESGPQRVEDYATSKPAGDLFTKQTLDQGFNYIETRDGTTLSALVKRPSGTGPFPTVVEYSGYEPSRPEGGQYTNSMAMLFNALGYAYVGVNIRGTGCSGGSFRNFEPIQSLDGYDAIETIAAQTWVKGKLGMIGVSYPGISQLYVAQTQPPSLGAIAPLSVISDTYRGTLYPGGILNTGFAVPWAAERAEQAAPYGQGWTRTRADNGDAVCAANQDLRLQNPDPLQLIKDNRFDGWLYDQINPSKFVHKIDVPVFLAGTWQDEQTGGFWPTFIDKFTSAPVVYATITNGVHVEAIVSLPIFDRYADFFDLYVAERKPGGIKNFAGPLVAQQLTHAAGMTMPPLCGGPNHAPNTPCTLNYTGKDYAASKALFESTAGVRVLFEEGAGQGAGQPYPRTEATFSQWPLAEAKPWKLFLKAKAKMAAKPVKVGIRKAKPRSYVSDPTALPATTHDTNGDGAGEGDVWGTSVDYDWLREPKGTALRWTTSKLKRKKVLIGSGSVDLWVKAKGRDTDFEVTISEVRPDGEEVYVQSGWLRASHRKLDKGASTITRPVHTHLESDVKPLPKRKWAKVRIELFPFAHAFRKGSKVRITLDAPGNSRPLWAFAESISDGERVRVRADKRKRSRVVLSAVSGVPVAEGSPACGSLRAQPCRDREPSLPQP